MNLRNKFHQTFLAALFICFFSSQVQAAFWDNAMKKVKEVTEEQLAEVPGDIPSESPASQEESAASSPSETSTTASTSATAQPSNNNEPNEEPLLPQEPVGAEETLTNLYLSIVRLRPDFLDQKFDAQASTSLLDMILQENPERYGLDRKSVQEFKNNEFTHNQRLAEYKELVLNAAVNAPLRYQHKVDSYFSEYNFETQAYAIGSPLEIATIYGGPFVRLFEGMKELEELDMSPNDAEELSKWYAGDSGIGHKTVAAFWNYEIKSIKHTSDMSSLSWISGFIAEVEPLELVLYGKKTVAEPRKKGEIGMNSKTHLEFKHLTSLSLSDISKSEHIMPLPSFNIAGVEFGASSEEVIAAIKSHNADLTMKKETKSLDIPDSSPYLNTLSNGGTRVDSLDQFRVWFAAPPFENVVIGINRDLNLKTTPSPFKAVVSALENKYGTPDKSIRQRSSNNTYYDHEYVWLDDNSAGQLTVILGVRDQTSVERMTFRASSSFNRQDIARTYQRNQQLWRSYHSGESVQAADNSGQAENVPAF